jgi:hypothetical protein
MKNVFLCTRTTDETHLNSIIYFFICLIFTWKSLVSIDCKVGEEVFYGNEKIHLKLDYVVSSRST